MSGFVPKELSWPDRNAIANPFPVAPYEPRANYPAQPLAIEQDLLEPFADRVRKNHSQTLEQLKARGGLSAGEVCAILEDRDVLTVRQFDHVDSLIKLWQLVCLRSVAIAQGAPGLPRIIKPRLTDPANARPIPDQEFFDGKPLLSVSIVYVHLPDSGDHLDWAGRFIQSYRENPPGMDHETIVVCNRAPATAHTRSLFACLPNVRFINHDDSGWDIGAYQRAAFDCASDLIVCLGSSVYFKTPGWLRYMEAAARLNGLGLYGAHGNAGDLPNGTWPHVRTTGFWLQTRLFNAFPKQVATDERYEFEHGKNSFPNWIKAQGFPVLVVTNRGVYAQADWDSAPDAFHRGDQSALLLGDRLTEPPFYHTR